MFTGSKFEATKDLKTKDIAKLIRAELNEISTTRRKGDRFEFRVRTGRSGWMSTIDITITAKPEDFPIHNRERVQQDLNHVHHSHAPWMAEEAREFIARVEAIVNAYNWDKSDPMTDYHNSRFFQCVRFWHELARADREKAEAELAPRDTIPVPANDVEEEPQVSFMRWVGVEV